MKKIYLAWVMLLSLGSTLWIEKVSAGPVHVIRNNSDWIAFRDAVGSAGGSRVDARLETDITTDAEGKAKVEFFNNSTCEEMYISVEGMTPDGKVLVNE